MWNKALVDLQRDVYCHDIAAKNSISLVASGTTVSSSLLDIMRTDLLNRAAEGKGAEGIFPGLEKFYEIEDKASSLISKIFSAEFAELRPISGSQANMIIMHAFAEPGSVIMTPRIRNGGHVSTSGRVARSIGSYKFVHPEVEYRSFNVDEDDFIEKVNAERPKIVYFGGSVVIEAQDIERMVAAAHSVGAIVVYDASHVAGLIATGQFPNPIESGVDLMSMTTCKTIPGPSHAWIVGRKKYAEAIDRIIFPGFVSGGHLQEYIGAIYGLYEMMSIKKAYGEKVVSCARVLAAELEYAGFDVIKTSWSNFTDTHQVMCERHRSFSPEEIQEKLASIGIWTNTNLLPRNKGFASEEGIRFGSQEAVWLGLEEDGFRALGAIIRDFLGSNYNDPHVFREAVRELRAKMNGIKLKNEEMYG